MAVRGKLSFGLPYMGSKNFYARQICNALPSGKRLVDLFAGGCAITDCAIRKYDYKWGSFLINDIVHEPLDLYVKCLCGENPVSYNWVSKDEFKSKDWATRLVWSFGTDTAHYLYSQTVAPIKHDLETWIITGNKLNDSGIFDSIKLPILTSLQDRFDWWRTYGTKLVCNTSLPRIGDLKRLERLERLERMERLHLENLEFERLKVSYLSYEQYEYCEGDVVYCDIPYKGTHCKQYNNTGFDHNAFWGWARSQTFDVYVSERIVPDDSEVIMTKDIVNCAGNKGTDGFKTEHLVRI